MAPLISDAVPDHLRQGLLTKHSRLDRLTTLGVNLSTFAFVGLQVPQITQNFMSPAEDMKGLSWTGYVSGSMGNVLLATYFASISEWAQVRVQAIGAITNYFVATQVYMAGYFPAPQFWTLAMVLLVGLMFPTLLALGAISRNTFSVWKEATTAIGLEALAFSVAATFFTEDAVLLGVAMAGLFVGILLLGLKPCCPVLAPVTERLGGWMATFLFMWMPVPEIVKILTVGKNAADAFNMGFTVLATIGNGLGVARAFFIKDTIWFTGSFFGIVIGGWATALAVCKVDEEQCPPWVVICYTMALVAYFALLVKLNGRATYETLRQQLSFLGC